MKVAEIRITEAILFKLGLLSLVNFSAREYSLFAYVGAAYAAEFFSLKNRGNREK
jgi:hypothetical protein